MECIDRSLGAVVLWTLASVGSATAQELVLEGVTPEIARAIDRGLQFLARTQNRDGSWRSSGGFGNYPTAMTALAGMALCGSGSTPTRGPYFLHVRRATEFLLTAAQPDGVITAPAEEGRSMYGHGFSTMFLNYDLLARRWVRYGYIYPFAEALAGVLMIAGALTWLAAPVALFIGTIGTVSVMKAVYVDRRELKCACVGGDTNVPRGAISLTENVMMVVMAVWMVGKDRFL